MHTSISNTKLRLIVAGSRNFSDYLLLKYVLDKIIKGRKDIIIVSGGCKGPDMMGERYANENELEIVRFLPDWSKGKKAGPIRNRQMAEVADKCICFYDGISRGTKSMIDICKEKDIPCLVVDINNKKIFTVELYCRIEK